MCNACRSTNPRPGLSRRRFLQATALAGTATMAATGAAREKAAPVATSVDTPAVSSMEEPVTGITTLTRSLAPAAYRVPGHPYRRSGAESGWPLAVREDLAVASRPIDVPGLAIPWYTGFGNHDITDAGTLPPMSGPAMLLDLLSTGDQLPYGLPAGMSIDDFFGTLLKATSEQQVRTIIAQMPIRTVPASEGRRLFSRQQFIQMHLESQSRHSVAGHGFTQTNLDDDTAYYQFELASRITGIMLDTTNPYGGPDGSLDPDQVSWLEARLIAAHARYLDANGLRIDTNHEDQLVVLFSHHNSRALDNLAKAPGATSSDRMASIRLSRHAPALPERDSLGQWPLAPEPRVASSRPERAQRRILGGLQPRPARRPQPGAGDERSRPRPFAPPRHTGRPQRRTRDRQPAREVSRAGMALRESYRLTPPLRSA